MSAKNDKPLGRGLDAILGGVKIPSANPQSHHTVGSNSFIKLESIEANPYQPRTKFDEEELQELAQSIKTYGLIQPVTVRPLRMASTSSSPVNAGSARRNSPD